VVLIHQGGQTSARTVLDPSCPDFSGPIVELADQFDAAVDVVISGHTHQEYVCTRPDGKLVTQTGSYGRLVSLIDLQVDIPSNRVVAKEAHNRVVFNGGVVRDAHGKPLPLPRGATVPEPDAGVQQIVQRYGDLTAPVSDLEVGRLAMALDRRTNAAGESSLGAVIADAYLAGSSDTSNGDKPAQIAFTNPGGLRADLNTSLSVTYGQLFSVLPFQNRLVSMDLTGQQILRLLEQQWERPQSGDGRVLPVSAGFPTPGMPVSQRVLRRAKGGGWCRVRCVCMAKRWTCRRFTASRLTVLWPREMTAITSSKRGVMCGRVKWI